MPKKIHRISGSIFQYDQGDAISTLPGKKESLVARIIRDPARWGFAEAKFINAPQIILGQWPRTWCHVHCPMAHSLITSPPAPPNYDDMLSMISEYRFGLMMRADVLPNSPRKSQYTIFSDRLMTVEEELRDIGYPKAFAMAASSCLFAPPESDERPCDYPHKNRPTIEALCIDLEQTLEQIQWEGYVEDFQSGLEHLFGIILVK